jgi:undecaprenyl-diphosphatase
LSALLAACTLGAAAAESAAPLSGGAGIGFWEGLLFGLIQGVTEFIPVSSSGHLVVGRLLRQWMGGAPVTSGGAENAAFDVTVHAATLFAMALYFRDEVLSLLRERTRLIGLIFMGCVPAGLVGLFFGDWFENIQLSRFAGYAVGGAFIINGLFLVSSKFFGIETKRLDDLRPSDSLLVGLAQAVALTPGISRSGITITSGLICGLRRSEAFTFSFLLGMPIISAAAVYKLKDIGQLAVSDSWGGLAGGFMAAFVTGLIAVWILARMVRRRNLLPFGVYTLVLGAVVIVCRIVWG